MTDHRLNRAEAQESKTLLAIEVADIDKKFIRGDLSAAGHAILTGRRNEIMQELAAQSGTLSRFAKASKRAFRQGGEKTGHHVASLRDQAKRTGEPEDKVRRSKRRCKILGSRLLYKIIGTSLDSARELDALAQLADVEREALAIRAAAGESVSARMPGRKRRRASVRRRRERGRQQVK